MPSPPLPVPVHDDIHSELRVPLHCFVEPIAGRPPPEDAGTRGGGFREPTTMKQPRSQSGPRLVLRLLVVGILGVTNILNFWLASSDILRLGCEIAMPLNIASLTRVCQSSIVKAASAGRQGVFGGFDGPLMHSDWKERLEGIEDRLRRIDDVLGMNDGIDLDVALRGGGAQILTGFTSPAPTPGSTSTSTMKTSWHLSHLLLGPPSQQQPPQDDGVRLPVVVLEEPAILGDCWEFVGSRGTIGIRLATSVNITALSVDYIPFNRLSPYSRKRAPKSLTLWGLMGAAQGSDTMSAPSVDSRSAQDFLVGTELPESIAKDDRFVSLVHVTYELQDQGKRVFVRDDYHASINRMYSVVVIEVTDNWGANSTCLYHVGVHGIALDIEQLES